MYTKCWSVSLYIIRFFFIKLMYRILISVLVELIVTFFMNKDYFSIDLCAKYKTKLHSKYLAIKSSEINSLFAWLCGLLNPQTFSLSLFSCIQKYYKLHDYETQSQFYRLLGSLIFARASDVGFAWFSNIIPTHDVFLAQILYK